MYNGVNNPNFDWNKINDVPQGSAKLLYNSNNADIEMNCSWAEALQQLQGEEMPAIMYDKVTGMPITFVSPADGEIYPLPCSSSTRARFVYAKRDMNGLMYFDNRGFPVIMYKCEDNVPREFQFRGVDDYIIKNHFTQLSSEMRKKLMIKDAVMWEKLIRMEYGNVYPYVAQAIDQSYGNEAFPAVRRQEWNKRKAAAGLQQDAQPGDARFYQYNEIPGMISDAEHEQNMQRAGTNGFRFGTSDNEPNNSISGFGNGFDSFNGGSAKVGVMDINPDCDPFEYEEHINAGGSETDFVDSKGQHILISRNGQKQQTNAIKEQAAVQHASETYGHSEAVLKLAEEISKVQKEMKNFEGDDEMLELLGDEIKRLKAEIASLKGPEAVPTTSPEPDFKVVDKTEDKGNVPFGHEKDNPAFGYSDEPEADFEKFDSLEDYAIHMDAQQAQASEKEQNFDEIVGQAFEVQEEDEFDMMEELVNAMPDDNPFDELHPIGSSNLNVDKLYSKEYEDISQFQKVMPNITIGLEENVIWVRINETDIIPAWRPIDAFVRPSIHGSIAGKISIDLGAKELLVTARNNIICDIVVDKSELEELGEDRLVNIGLGDGFLQEIETEDDSHVELLEEDDMIINKEVVIGTANEVAVEINATNREAGCFPLHTTQVHKLIPGLLNVDKIDEVLRSREDEQDGEVQALACISKSLYEQGEMGVTMFDKMIVNFLNYYAFPKAGLDYLIESFVNGDADFIVLKKELFDNAEKGSKSIEQFQKVMDLLKNEFFGFYSFCNKTKYLTTVPESVKEGLSTEDINELRTVDGKYEIHQIEIGAKGPIIDLSLDEVDLTYGPIKLSNVTGISPLHAAHSYMHSNKQMFNDYDGHIFVIDASGTIKRIKVDYNGVETKFYCLPTAIS